MSIGSPKNIDLVLNGYYVTWRVVRESQRREKSREVDLYTLWNSILLFYISLTIGRSLGYITTKHAPRALLSLKTKESYLGTRCASVCVDRS